MRFHIGYQYTQSSLSRLFQLVFLLIMAQVGLGQQRLFTNQQHFGVEEGLPQSFISDIIQDADGFIWLATLDGFSRYDGRGFKTVHYNPKDSTGLAANSIISLGRPVNNHITIYYGPTQADDFNLRTFKVTRNNIRDRLDKIPNAWWQSYHISLTTNYWFFLMRDSKGVGWLNSNTGKIHYANKANGILQYDTISAIVQSKEGRIYLVSENGVQVSDTSGNNFEWIRFATYVKRPATKILPDEFGEHFSIVCLPGNRLAIGEKGKINLLDLNQKTSTIFSPPPSTRKGLPSLNYEMQVDANGLLYFENYGRIFRLTENGELKLLWENSKTTLPISAFFIDRSDVLWVSVDAQGLLKIDLQTSPFQSYSYRANFISDILEEAGVSRNAIPKNWANSGASYAFRQAYDSKGNLSTCASWLDQSDVFQLNQQGFRSFSHLPQQPLYTALLVMPGDATWVFDQVESAWYGWKTPGSIPEKLLLDKQSMKDIELADARFIGGFTWLSTYNHGLLQYDGNKRINQFRGAIPNGIMPETLTEICPDPHDPNRFWIGSRGGGLILWDARKGLQRIYTIEHGLPNNTIYCILPDKAGNIWCSTNKGIFKIDIKTGQVTAFEKTDGLPGNEFNRAHKFIFPDGRLAFGGLDGYTIFNPADFESKNETGDVPVLLTGLQINNQSQDVNLPNGILTEPLSTLTRIELPHNKNYLRFEFAAMLFNQPQKTKYRYQLEGADAGWIDNGTSNIASYAALRPGSYTLRLNASDKNGLWSNTVKEIEILIDPPFWFSWWAFLLYALVAVVLMRWYFIFRERQLKTAQNLTFEKREALRLKEVDELKDRFFSNITHEFRTPLTLILTPLEKLVQDPSLPPAAISTLKTAQRNSKQLLRLINEFLDFSKLNNGQLKLKLSTGELDLFTADCVQSFEAAAKDKNIDLHFSAREVSGFYLFDEEKWEKIVSNLLGNALKFTPKNGVVSVSLSSWENNTIQLEVKDNGPGIPADQQQKIFNRFYQVDDSAIRTYGGTGIGLSLVKELTELMGGTIGLVSSPGGDTSFIVSVPLAKTKAVEVIEAAKTAINERPTNVAGEQDLPLLLVVEDNDELRSFLMETMRNRYRVIEAADGLAAWEMILQELPDIVISDVMMPGQDGFDLCQLCKTDNRTAHIGFLLLTSKAAHDARLKGLGLGADDYITKPFSLQELELRTGNLVQLQVKLRRWLHAQLVNTDPRVELPALTDPFLLKLYQELDARLDDPQLGVDYLSKTLAMSRSTLSRKLKSLIDIAPNELIRQYRLQKGAHLLSSGLDISTVAYRVGFSSHSYFSQCFKEQYGITPTEYVSANN